ncbi:hypothetical protein RT717_16840 [Imperialibacter roseus]|uniref:Uncharacterized protein n=2 Tax=Imperialibacter TaxID=1649461 RepID=A0ABZ0IL83_9BACT|nr:hypothetical protein [Imperialibacter roseus]WOK04750.1 hypothetical protein RT717_16840 [Imperialibacter roseus]
MLKKHLLIIVSLFLLASTTEFLWMESLSGKEDLFEVESELSNQLEEKSSLSYHKFKIPDIGWPNIANSSYPFNFDIPFSAPSEHPTKSAEVAPDKRLYLLYCQLRHHC